MTVCLRPAAGAVCAHLGDFVAAKLLLREALAERRRTRGPVHPETLESTRSLGALHREMQDYGAADELLLAARANPAGGAATPLPRMFVCSPLQRIAHELRRFWCGVVRRVNGATARWPGARGPPPAGAGP
jgi:hypothetical protein